VAICLSFEQASLKEKLAIRNGWWALFLRCLAVPLMADEGDVPFNSVPKAAQSNAMALIKRLLVGAPASQLRSFNNGGSGSFVSANGLVMTNHHVTSDCIQKLSSAGKDFMREGSCSKPESGQVSDLELNVLLP
jgi:S1-C subfamily serine protease